MMLRSPIYTSPVLNGLYLIIATKLIKNNKIYTCRLLLSMTNRNHVGVVKPYSVQLGVLYTSSVSIVSLSVLVLLQLRW